MKRITLSILLASQLTAASLTTVKSQLAPEGCQKLTTDTDWPETALPDAEARGLQNPLKTRPDYQCEANTVSKVQNAVKFAASKNVRLSVMNSGHDFIGRNDAPSGLSLQVAELKGVRVLESFTPTPQGAESVTYKTVANTIKTVEGKQAAATIGGGVNIDELNKALKPSGLCAMGAAHGEASVAGGQTQAGGHAALSSNGMGADQVLELKVVLANGALVTANPTTNQDLFLALRGGGPGTFGVVVEATVKVYPTFRTELATTPETNENIQNVNEMGGEPVVDEAPSHRRRTAENHPGGSGRPTRLIDRAAGGGGGDQPGQGPSGQGPPHNPPPDRGLHGGKRAIISRDLHGKPPNRFRFRRTADVDVGNDGLDTGSGIPRNGDMGRNQPGGSGRPTLLFDRAVGSGIPRNGDMGRNKPGGSGRPALLFDRAVGSGIPRNGDMGRNQPGGSGRPALLFDRAVGSGIPRNGDMGRNQPGGSGRPALLFDRAVGSGIPRNGDMGRNKPGGGDRPTLLFDRAVGSGIPRNGDMGRNQPGGSGRPTHLIDRAIDVRADHPPKSSNRQGPPHKAPPYREPPGERAIISRDSHGNPPNRFRFRRTVDAGANLSHRSPPTKYQAPNTKPPPPDEPPNSLRFRRTAEAGANQPRKDQARPYKPKIPKPRFPNKSSMIGRDAHGNPPNKFRRSADVDVGNNAHQE
ncbi:FAD-binding domain-containing protein [Venturia nashicola]|nr:FAD-binding domain-containing protein [Venturia nashicola]